MSPTAAERLRGMMLLSAYGDALGADHETNNAIHPAPFPKQLPQQTLDSERTSGVTGLRQVNWTPPPKE